VVLQGGDLGVVSRPTQPGCFVEVLSLLARGIGQRFHIFLYPALCTHSYIWFIKPIVRRRFVKGNANMFGNELAKRSRLSRYMARLASSDHFNPETTGKI
jgi:hypothetical protein